MPRRRQAPLSIKNIFAVLMLAVIAGCSNSDTAPNGPPVDYNQAIRAKTEGARLAGPVPRCLWPIGIFLSAVLTCQ